MNTNDGVLKLFQEIIHQMFSTEDTRLIQNDSKNCACIVIAELLKSATQEALIFCNCLDLDVWCDRKVLEGLRCAISNCIKIDVLLRNEPEALERNLAYKLLCESPGGVVNITSSKTIIEDFIVVDNKAYHFEQDNRTHKGFSCANDSENALVLAHAFYNLKLSELETPSRQMP